MAESFLGEISPVAFSFAPRGWALCNGQLLSINQHRRCSHCWGPCTAATA